MANRLSDIVKTIDSSEKITDKIIDTCVLELCNVIRDAGSSHYTLIKTNNSNISGKAQPNSWYDSDCRYKKRLFDIYEKTYRETLLEEDRINMCRARNEYRKCCRYKRTNFQVEKANDLLNISKNNPKKFWKILKKKKSPRLLRF